MAPPTSLVFIAAGRTRSAFAGETVDSDDPVAFEWRVPAAQVDVVRNSLKFDGHETSEQDARGLPLLVIFIGLALLPYLAKSILTLQRQLNYGGVVLDTRGPTIIITHDKALDGGIILIVSPDGTKIVERNEITDPAALMNAMRSSAKK